MSDEAFLDLLYERWRDPAYRPQTDEYIQLRADELIATGHWHADERDELLKVIRDSHDPKSAFKGPVLDSIKDVAFKCLGTKAEQITSIPVGFLPTNDFNACAVKNPSGGCVVVMNSGIDSALQLIFYSYLAISTYPFEHAFDRSHDILDFAQSIIQVAHSVATGTPDGVVLMPTWDCHEKALQDDTVLTFALIADAFVLLHEYGHVILGHLADAPIGTMRIGRKEEEVLLPSHVQEFEADSFAFDHLWQLMANNSSTGLLMSVGVLFRFFELCDAVVGRSGSSTHPVPLDRWNRIKAFASAEQLADPDVRNVDAVFDNIIQIQSMLVPVKVSKS